MNDEPTTNTNNHYWPSTTVYIICTSQSTSSCTHRELIHYRTVLWLTYDLPFLCQDLQNQLPYLKSYAYGRLASADLCPPHTVISIWIFTLNVRLLTNINRRAFTFPCIILFLYTITELTESLLLWLKTLQRASSVCYHDLPAFNYCFNGLFFSSCQNPAINFIAWRQYIHHIFLCSGKTLKYDAVSVDQFSVW